MPDWAGRMASVSINDPRISVSLTVHMFADDCLLYCEVHRVEDTKRLQDDLDSLQAWERDWLMEFNPSKCEAITFTKKTKPVQCSYKIHTS